MFNHLQTERAEDRKFSHFLPLKGRIHLVEVYRKEGLYTAKAFLGAKFYPQDEEEKKIKYPIVALSIGTGFSSLQEAIRSLRKDLEFEAWSRASMQARIGQVLDEVDCSAWAKPQIS